MKESEIELNGALGSWTKALYGTCREN